MNRKTALKRISAWFLVPLLLASSLNMTVIATSGTATGKEGTAGTSTASQAPGLVNTYKKDSYEVYLEKYKGALSPATEVVINAVDYKTLYNGMQVESIADLGGKTGPFLRMGDEGGIEWEVDVPETGFYNILLQYYPIKGKSSTIERELYVDGDLPFEGARSFILSRVWGDKGEKIVTSDGNEFRPNQVEKPMWRDTYVSGTLGYTMSNFKFYFTAGKHTLRFNSIREPVVINTITLKQEKPTPTYAQYMASLASKGVRDSQGQQIKIQAEGAVYKSDPVLYARSDRSSPVTEPYHLTKLKLNTLGGLNWRYSRMWVTWEFEVEQDGLYQIDLRCKQDFNVDTASTRKILIDGEVPYKELENVVTRYSRDWQINTPGGDEPFKVYLTRGKHTLTLDSNLGPVAELLQTVEKSVLVLNDIYRKIIMITGSFPDPLRDYRLHERIPETMVVFRQQSEILQTVMDRLVEIAGNKGNDAAKFEKIIVQMKMFLDDPEKIPEQLDNFRINTSSISSWILTASEQPLLLDYILLRSPDTQKPKVDASTVGRLVHEFRGFLSSFVEDYSIIGDTTDLQGTEEENTVTLWMGGGRDQAMVMKGLIDNYFTTQTGIRVNLRLVDMGILLRAVASGRGPDLALFEGQAMPMNYALRNALYDLKNFTDLEEVLKRFSPSAVEPFRYGESVWALPETQSYPVLFYRKDILESLGLKVPNTWTELLSILPELQKHYLQFSMPSAMEDGVASYMYFLFQNGGNIYNAEKSRCIIDDSVGVRSFIQWTEMYTRYKIPTVANELDRFRRGETPIIIAGYTLSNSLMIAAPEIRGLWDFTLMLGTEKPDGTIDRSAPSGATGCCMFKNAKNPQATWEFMKWWTSTQTQVSYGLEMESLQGASARWPTANIEAMWQLPWPTSFAKVIEAQRAWVKPVPEVPGGYMLSRNIENAFRITYNLGGNPRDTFLDWIRYINKEIIFKRQEFGLE